MRFLLSSVTIGSLCGLLAAASPINTTDLLEAAVASPQARQARPRPIPGTNRDNYPTPPGFSLTNKVSPPSNINSYTSEPDYQSSCGTYKLVAQYSEALQKIPLCHASGAGCVKVEDVVQGQTGDCGFGAALVALIANKQAKLLTDALVVKSKHQLEATFKTRAGAAVKTTKVKLDDKLPVFVTGSETSLAGCWPNLGFQQCNDPDYNDGVACTPYNQVAFLEKAWVKYVDFKGAALRAQQSKQFVGYKGIEGTDAARVLEAFTGRRPQRLYRGAADFPSASMKTQFKRCLDDKRACVLGTLAGPVEKENQPTDYRIKDTGKAIKGQALKRSLGGGSTIEPVEDDNHMYIVYDAKAKKTFKLAREHAYAILNDKSTSKLLFIRNPWGCSDGSCDAKGNGESGTISMSWDVAASVFNALYRSEGTN